MAALPPSRVHLGFWIDYTHGSIMGATLTTTSSNANLVIAILSLLVSFSGSHLWDLIAFFSYLTGVSNQPRRLIHHQLQALARNITSPGAFLLEITKLGWSWRHHSAWSALANVAAFAILCSVGFLVAGVFVSQVVSSSELQVLAKSESCGYLSWRNESTSLHREYQQSVFHNALVYSETCYDRAVRLPQCSIYVKQAVPILPVTHTECPFQDLCTKHPALKLDTGLLDSKDVFGMNTNSKRRVQMQRVVTCAPLDLNRFFTQHPVSPDFLRRFDAREALPSEELYEWSVGRLTTKSIPLNSTFWQSSYISTFSRIFALTPRSYYMPVSDHTIEGLHNSTFIPIPELRRENADTHVIAIQSNGVTFFVQNNDPLFSAHKVKYVTFDNGANITMYTGDSPSTFLGCTDQVRFCFSKNVCTSLLGIDAAYDQARTLAPTLQQKAILQYLFLQSPTVYGVTTAPMLVTRNAASFQLGIPSDQWQLEVEAWFNYILATTQTTIPLLAAGPGIIRSDFDQLAQPLVDTSLCHAQRMGAPDGFSNINVFGLTLIVSLSGFVILINLSLVPVLKYLYWRNIITSPHIESWILNGILQIQRQVYSGMGDIEWKYRDTDIPIIEDNPLISGLDNDIFSSRSDTKVPMDHSNTTASVAAGPMDVLNHHRTSSTHEPTPDLEPVNLAVRDVEKASLPSSPRPSSVPSLRPDWDAPDSPIAYSV